MAVRHSDRHFDPHGHRHGPRRDELHGSRVATAKYGAYSKKKFPPLRCESRRGNDFLDDCFLDDCFLDDCFLDDCFLDLLTGG